MTAHTKRKFSCILLLACLGGLFFSACGGGPHISGNSITGIVNAPNGLVAQGHPSLFTRLYALSKGPELPAPEVIVQLIRVDNSGKEVALVSTTHTAMTGRFRVMVPPGVSLDSRLMVRVTGANEVQMRAMVTNEDVILDARSELLIRRVLARGYSLADLTTTEARALRGYLDGLDFESYVQTTLADTYAAIPAEVLADFDSQVDSLALPDTASPITNGEYYVASISAELHTGSPIRKDIEHGSLIYSASGPSTGSFLSQNLDSRNGWLDCSDGGGYPQYGLSWSKNVGSGALYEVSSGGSKVAIAKPSTLVLDTPIAHRRLDSTYIFNQSSTNSFLANGIAVYEYHPVSSTNELDLNQLLGRGIASDISVLIQKGALSQTLIDGATYGVIRFFHQWDSDGWRDISADLFTCSFSLAGTYAGSTTIYRNPSRLRRGVHSGDFACDLSWNSPDPNDPNSGDATINLVNERTISVDGTTGDASWFVQGNLNRTGIFSPDGAIFVIPHSSALVYPNGSSINRGHLPQPDVITTADLTFGVKLLAGNPTLTPGSYRVLWLELGFRTTGDQFITFSPTWTAEVLNETNISFHGTKTAYHKTFDCDPNYSTSNETFLSGAPQSATGGFQNFNGAPCGYYRLDGGGVSYRGFWNEDATLGVFRVFNNTLDTGGDLASLGMAIFIRQ